MMNKKKEADWQELLEQLLAETDRTALREKADQLESAIFFRTKELESGGDGYAERQAMRDASNILLQTRSEQP
jgi:hypothetical protein